MFKGIGGNAYGISLTPPQGTLTPLIPLSLRAFKGEGETRTEACAFANGEGAGL